MLWETGHLKLKIESRIVPNSSKFKDAINNVLLVLSKWNGFR